MNSSQAGVLQKQLVSASPAFKPARQKLEAILAQPEFAEKMRQATAWEQWQQRVATWFSKHLPGLFDAIAKHPSATSAIFWIAALAALGFIAVQLFRIFRLNEQSARLEDTAAASASRTAVNWAAAARLAADQADFNTAIQCSYWAGIACRKMPGLYQRPKTPLHASSCAFRNPTGP